jgi:hypothetical protein
MKYIKAAVSNPTTAVVSSGLLKPPVTKPCISALTSGVNAAATAFDDAKVPT